MIALYVINNITDSNTTQNKIQQKGENIYYSYSYS